MDLSVNHDERCGEITYVEWEHGMRCLNFPDDEERDAKDADHKRSNDWGSVPLGLDATGKGEGLRHINKAFQAVT